MLRIVEREGQWIEASITNWKIAAEEAEAEPNPEARNWLPGFKRVKVPEPAVKTPIWEQPSPEPAPQPDMVPEPDRCADVARSDLRPDPLAANHRAYR